MNKSTAIILAILVSVVSWMVILELQPQPYEGWSVKDKLKYQYMWLPDIHTVLNVEDDEVFCDTKMHIAMEKGAFFGLHLPMKDESGSNLACFYVTERYNQPWDRYSDL
jgi:hypothetical protein